MKHIFVGTFLLVLAIIQFAATAQGQAKSSENTQSFYGENTVDIVCIPHPTLSAASYCQAVTSGGTPSSYQWGAQGSASILFSHADVAEVQCDLSSSELPVVYVSVRFFNGGSLAVIGMADCSGH